MVVSIFKGLEQISGGMKLTLVIFNIRKRKARFAVSERNKTFFAVKLF
jgi:hypothetical protein